MAIVYLIPSLLHEEGIQAIPPYVLDAVNQCRVFFVENERTTRRYLKQLKKAIIIDDHEWFVIDNDVSEFKRQLKQGKTIGIISEAGCPGVADPGQLLIAAAHEMNADVRPLVGPNSILLALMASGMNGQQFRFYGYLPIDKQERDKAVKELEAESKKKNSTQLFIETPYRNNQLLESLLRNCNASTNLCVAANLTGKNEWIKTKTVEDWKKDIPDLHKQLVIFLIYSGSQ